MWLILKTAQEKKPMKKKGKEGRNGQGGRDQSKTKTEQFSGLSMKQFQVVMREQCHCGGARMSVFFLRSSQKLSLPVQKTYKGENAMLKPAKFIFYEQNKKSKFLQGKKSTCIRAKNNKMFT